MSLQQRIEALTGERVLRLAPLQGGDLSEVRRVVLQDGTALACKTGPLVAVEAEMLTEIGKIAPAPTPLHIAGDLLLMTYLPPEPKTNKAWHGLGEALQQMHQTRSDAAGWHRDYGFGSVIVENSPCPRWPEFWANRRLRPCLSTLPPDLARRVETLAHDLANRLPDQAHGLLHGDLWTGNVHFSGNQAWLIDPACYFGDGEVDLAMLQLFGHPPAPFWQGYGALAPGHTERRPIYQLWPALVHYRLFGAGYAGMVERLLEQAGV